MAKRINSCVLVSTVLLTVFSLAHAEYFCNEEEVEKCLKPSHDYLVDNVNNDRSFLLTSIKHFLRLLDGEDHANEIHVSSLDTILLPLDSILYEEGPRLQEICVHLKESTECLDDWTENCDAEIGLDMQGLIDVFTLVCAQSTRRIFMKEQACVFHKNVTNELTKCEQSLNHSISSLNLPPPACVDSDNVTEECSKAVANLPNKLLRDGLVIPVDNQNAHVVYRAGICVSVESALICHFHAVSSVCGNDAGLWEKKLRHALIKFLLIDLNCEEEDAGAYNASCFSCDVSTCLDNRQVCDGEQDCKDGSDESKKRCDSGGMGALGIVIIVALVLIVIGIVIGCVVKCIQDRDYTATLGGGPSDSEEMLDIVTEELSVGRSTPPPSTYNSNDKRFVYKPIQT